MGLCWTRTAACVLSMHASTAILLFCSGHIHRQLVRTRGSLSAKRSSRIRLPLSAAVTSTSCAAMTGMLRSHVRVTRCTASFTSAEQSSAVIGGCTVRTAHASGNPQGASRELNCRRHARRLCARRVFTQGENILAVLEWLRACNEARASCIVRIGTHLPHGPGNRRSACWWRPKCLL